MSNFTFNTTYKLIENNAIYRQICREVALCLFGEDPSEQKISFLSFLLISQKPQIEGEFGREFSTHLPHKLLLLPFLIFNLSTPPPPLVSLPLPPS